MKQIEMAEGVAPGKGKNPFKSGFFADGIFPKRAPNDRTARERGPDNRGPKEPETKVTIADGVVGLGEALDAKIFKVMAFGDLPAKNGTDLRGYEVYLYDFHPETVKGESIELEVRSKAMLNGGREGSAVIFVGEKEYQIRISENPGVLLSKRIEVFEIRSVSESR